MRSKGHSLQGFAEGGSGRSADAPRPFESTRPVPVTVGAGHLHTLCRQVLSALDANASDATKLVDIRLVTGAIETFRTGFGSRDRWDEGVLPRRANDPSWVLSHLRNAIRRRWVTRRFVTWQEAGTAVEVDRRRVSRTTERVATRMRNKQP